MSNPTNATTDAQREALIVELEATNQQLHRLRLKATQLQQQLAALKSKPSSPSPPPKPLASPKKPLAKPKSPKPQAPEDDRFLMEGVSD